MKLQADRSHQQTVISLSKNMLLSSHGHRAEQGVMLSSEGDFYALTQVNFDEYIINQLNQLPLLQLEVLIIGTGKLQQFFLPKWRTQLIHSSIGIETMNTPAACRTFNVLSLEGRKVALWAKISD